MPSDKYAFRAAARRGPLDAFRFIAPKVLTRSGRERRRWIRWMLEVLREETGRPVGVASRKR